MEQAIKITRKQAKPLVDKTFPDYNGRKFRLVYTYHVQFYDLNWSGGTRNQYAAVRYDGKSVVMESWNAVAPWDNAMEGAYMPLTGNVIVVEHSDYCGKDCGITIYANPSVKLLGPENTFLQLEG